MHQIELPRDTSGGIFKTLADVGKQDAAAAAHYPILLNRFELLSDTVKENEEANKANAEDTEQAIDDIQNVLEDAIKDEKKGWFN